MKKKIFKAIWLAAIVVFLASFIFIMGINYSYFSDVQFRQLRDQTQLAAEGVILGGQEYLDKLGPANYRITWIAADGSIIYDSLVDITKMQNHSDRPEFKQAIETGHGEASRFSDTIAERQIYCARKLPDGTVLRLSFTQVAVWALIPAFSQPIMGVLIIGLIVSLAAASQVAKKITKPINEIDPDNPMRYYDRNDYKEVEPLLRRIAHQQSQLKSDRSAIERASLIRQEFTANVSHELKTPLHAISGYAELLEKGMVKAEDIKPFATKIRSESGRMTQLVEDIIDLTRLDSGRSDTTWENCDLYRITENAIDSLETAAETTKVELSLKGNSTPMRGIPEDLYSIVYNLCDNAIKYNKQGGRVDVTITSNQKDIRLSVKDTGIGIPEESRERIFERFYRVDKSRSKKAGGTGLGLSIVKHAALTHRARIELKSKVGEGSEFIVIFPKEKADN